MALELGKRLLEAARNGEDEEVRLLTRSGAPFTTDWLGTSPLHLAAQYGHFSTVKTLLQSGISRDARTKVDRTPLHMAAAEGHVDIVDLLIKNGANVNARDMLEMTALHWAAEHNWEDIASLLIESGAEVHASNKFGKTAFDIALEKNNPALLVMIQEAMHGQAPAYSLKPNTITVSPTQFILTPGGLTSADQIGAAVQQVVENGGQRVITIVTDGSHGGFSSAHIQHPLLVTIQNGDQVVTVPGEEVIEEVVTEDEPPPIKRSKTQVTDSSQDAPARQATKLLLQQQLHEANLRAREYRQQLLEKEQEAAGYKVKLENLVLQHTNGHAGFAVLDGAETIIVSTEELEGTEMTEIETVEHHCDITMESSAAV
ncbi:GA-binding protein subunit beta-2 [Gastrophryne carolinensis]